MIVDLEVKILRLKYLEGSFPRHLFSCEIMQLIQQILLKLLLSADVGTGNAMVNKPDCLVLTGLAVCLIFV